MANNDTYNFADLKIEKSSETFRSFERIIEKQGYMSLKAGILAALNFYIQYFKSLDTASQAKNGGLKND